MENLKCEECGIELTGEEKVCPNCGCPIKKKEKNHFMKDLKIKQYVSDKMFLHITALVIGLAIIIMGICVLNKKTDIDIHVAKRYDVPANEYGGDFYTDIYQASDTIAEELYNMNAGISAVSEMFCEAVKGFYYCTGMIIISIGLAVIAISLIHINHIKKEKKETIENGVN